MRGGCAWRLNISDTGERKGDEDGESIRSRLECVAGNDVGSDGVEWLRGTALCGKGSDDEQTGCELAPKEDGVEEELLADDGGVVDARNSANCPSGGLNMERDCSCQSGRCCSEWWP